MIKTIIITISILLFGVNCYSNETVNQKTYGDNSQNIHGETVNITGLAEKQFNELSELLNEIKKQDEEYRISRDKKLKEMDSLISNQYVNTLNQFKRENDFDRIFKENYQIIYEKNKLLNKQIEEKNIEKIEKSKEVIKKVNVFFIHLFDQINEKISAMEKSGNLNFQYKSNNVNLFVDDPRNRKKYIASRLTFSDKSELFIVLAPGLVKHGIVKSFPSVQFFKNTNDKMFFVVPDAVPKGGRLIFRNDTPEYMIEDKRSWDDLKYYPHGAKIVNESFFDELSRNILEVVVWMDSKSENIQ